MTHNKCTADPAGDQHLLDVAALADAYEGIRQALEDVKRGRTRPAREFFDSLKPNMVGLTRRASSARTKIKALPSAISSRL